MSRHSFWYAIFISCSLLFCSVVEISFTFPIGTPLAAETNATVTNRINKEFQIKFYRNGFYYGAFSYNNADPSSKISDWTASPTAPLYFHVDPRYGDHFNVIRYSSLTNTTTGMRTNNVQWNLETQTVQFYMALNDSTSQIYLEGIDLNGVVAWAIGSNRTHPSALVGGILQDSVNTLNPYVWHYGNVSWTRNGAVSYQINTTTFSTTSSSTEVDHLRIRMATNGTVYFDAIDISNSPNFVLNRNLLIETNNTLAANYREVDRGHFKGKYSFTSDTGTSVKDFVMTGGSVQNSSENHQKVVLISNGGLLSNEIDPQQTYLSTKVGQIDVWIKAGGGESKLEVKALTGSGLIVTFRADGIYGQSGQPYLTQFYNGNGIDNQWHHYSIIFNTKVMWNLTRDGVFLGNILFDDETNDINMEFINFRTFTGSSMIIDALDYTWASGYYPSRNLEEDTLKTIFPTYLYEFTVLANGNITLPFASPSPYIYELFSNGTQASRGRRDSPDFIIDYVTVRFRLNNTVVDFEHLYLFQYAIFAPDFKVVQMIGDLVVVQLYDIWNYSLGTFSGYTNTSDIIFDLDANLIRVWNNYAETVNFYIESTTDPRLRFTLSANASTYITLKNGTYYIIFQKASNRQVIYQKSINITGHTTLYTVPPNETVPPSEFDWMLVFYIALGVGGAVGVTFLIIAIAKYMKKRKTPSLPSSNLEFDQGKEISINMKKMCQL